MRWKGSGSQQQLAKGSGPLDVVRFTENGLCSLEHFGGGLGTRLRVRLDDVSA